MPIILSSDTVWTTGSIINLQDHVQIAPGVKLTIEPGVIIHGNGYDIQTFGNLVVNGTIDQPVEADHLRFTTSNDSNNPARLEVDHLNLVRGTFLPSYGYSSFDVTNSYFEDCGQFYVWYPTADSRIEGNIFDSTPLSIGTTNGVEVLNNVFLGGMFTQNYPGSAAIVVWASYGDPVKVAGNSFFISQPALEVTYSSSKIEAAGNFYGVSDPSQLAYIEKQYILDRKDTLDKPSVINLNPDFSGPNEVVRGLLHKLKDLTTLDPEQDFYPSKIVTGSDGEDTINVPYVWGTMYVFGEAGNDQILGSDGWEQLFGDGGDDQLFGFAGDDYLLGGSGNDALNGGVGNDYLDGGAGIDLATYSDASGGVTVDLSIQSANQNTLSAGKDTLVSIENLRGSNFNDILSGDASGNILEGGLGDDRISGQLGDDRIDGGSGKDTASYGDAEFGVTVSLSLQGSAQDTGSHGNDTLVSIEDLEGSSHSDRLSGDIIDNQLFGLEGNDVLQGQAGNDTLIGGEGDDLVNGGSGRDTASYEDAASRVVVSLAKQDRGQETRGAGRDTLVSIESVIGSDFGDNLRGNDNGNTMKGLAGDDRLVGAGGNDRLSGGDGNDRLSGGSGDDTLTGGKGDDILRGGDGHDILDGGSGNDLYFIDDMSDEIIEGAGQGIDTVYAGIDFTLGGNVENLRLRQGHLEGTGNELDNEIDGGGRGNNTLLGMGGLDIIHGGMGRDVIDGGSGEDRIYGDAGADRLTGGADADRFIFDDGHLGTSADVTDTITDFSHAEGDRISLRSVDADSTTAGDQDFVFVGQDAFSSTAGELRYGLVGGNTVVEMDTDGDGVADLFLMLTGEQVLIQGDFAL